MSTSTRYTTPPEHGTLRGWRSHKRLKTPMCEPCLTARREDLRATEARKPNAAQKDWNGGNLRAASRPGTYRDEQCTAPGCGSSGAQPAPRPDMVLVDVSGSREPARWYCPGWCAERGLALAEVRAIGAAA
ncbi:hypothetical protein ACWIG4_18080 [Streptomyces sp. NPDC002248]